MWDLIVSVPDHCLSFYFCRIFLYASTIDSRESRRAGKAVKAGNLRPKSGDIAGLTRVQECERSIGRALGSKLHS